MRWEPATGGDVVGVGVLVALLASFVYRTAAAAAGGHGAALVVALVLGVLAADFISGCLHWFADTFFAEDTPLIGRTLIESFREHHRDPLAMTRRSFLRMSHANVVATSVMLVAVWCLRVVAPSPDPSVFTDAFIMSLACALWWTNQFHKWAHLPRVPRAVAWLQASGLILSPARHARHHAASHGREFCVTTGWLNPLLDGAQVFTAAERVIRALQRKGTLASNR
jgi:ubiquitin-conjugating enzyme E2 variant